MTQNIEGAISPLDVLLELSLTQPTVLPRLDDLAPLLQTILIPDR